ncbi:1,3-beta-glucanosyltransferase gel4 [Rhizoctonia solani AG-1 IB]|uniref:1,3-beta-glucanosyltransferase n=1 Tax=Thanatephorus cucumeris (strain AG1-IB / isolate 7/3/14) TaxID=1108050 RepID=M5BIF1_THACB|nr:1,3-beta-glucanosyltransferase gel4 [Rhizoctonia solani AG-1 IB]
MKFFTTACALAALANSALALPKITRVGRYLFNPDGTRFYIKGIAYQEQGRLAVSEDPNAFPEPDNFVDPLALPDACRRDVPYLQRLTVNAIRVYSVNASLNHDDCMSALDAAGIYTMIDLSLPVNGSLDRSSPCLDHQSLGLNVLAYNIGNEVVTETNNTVAAPFIKAAARDVKAYLKSKGSSALVGYASTDGSGWRDPLATYLACDGDDDSLDIYGLNNYRWCGAGSFQGSYSSVQASFENYPIVAYFSEYGCVSQPPRLWTEATALFSSDMTPVWSGGLAFSYFEAFGGYGMVTLSADNTTVTTSDDFTRLQNVLSNVTFINEPTQSSASPSTYPACPAANTEFLASSTLPPTPNTATCECIKANSFSCLFTPTTEQGRLGVGQLLDNGCQLLGQAGGTCDAIAGNGQTGVYGPLSGCSPETKLSYVFSQYYERTNRNAQSCSFGGNATLANPLPSSSQAAAAAQSSCITSGPTGVVTPTAPASTRPPSSSSTSGSNGGGNGNNQNGVGKGAVVGLAVAVGAGLVSAVWVVL